MPQSEVEISTSGGIASPCKLSPSPSEPGHWPHHSSTDRPAFLLDVIGNCLETNPLISEIARNKAEIVTLKAKLTAERAAGRANLAAKQSRVQNLKLELGKARSDCRAAILMMERQAAVVQTAIQNVDASTIRLPAELWQLSRRMIKANRYTVPDIMVAWNVVKSLRGIILARAIILIALRGHVRTRLVRVWSKWCTVNEANVKGQASPSSGNLAASRRQCCRIIKISWRRQCARVFHKWHTATSVEVNLQRQRQHKLAAALQAAIIKAKNRRLSLRFAAWRAAAFEAIKLQGTLLLEHVYTLQGRLSALEAALYQVRCHSGEESPTTERHRRYWKELKCPERPSTLPQGASTIYDIEQGGKRSSEIPAEAETHPTTLCQNSRRASCTSTSETFHLPTYSCHACSNETTLQEAHAVEVRRSKGTCRRPSSANPSSLQTTVNPPVSAPPIFQPGTSTKSDVSQGPTSDNHSDEEIEPNSVETHRSSAEWGSACSQRNRDASLMGDTSNSLAGAVPLQERSEGPCSGARDTMTQKESGANASAGTGKIQVSGGFQEYVQKLKSKRAAATSSVANVHSGRRHCRGPCSARKATASWDAPSRWDQVAWNQNNNVRKRFEVTEPLAWSFRHVNNEGFHVRLSRPLSAPLRRTNKYNEKRCKPHQSARQKAPNRSALNVALDTWPQSPDAG